MTNKKSVVDEILGDLSKASAAKQIVLGSSLGWVTGFVAMKVGKAAALTVGSGILILQIANHKGYVKINWDKIARKAEKELTGNKEDLADEFSRFMDKKLHQLEDIIENKKQKTRRWYHSFVNNTNESGYQLQELHLFLASFVAGLTFGFAKA